MNMTINDEQIALLKKHGINISKENTLNDLFNIIPKDITLYNQYYSLIINYYDNEIYYGYTEFGGVIQQSEIWSTLDTDNIANSLYNILIQLIVNNVI